MHIRPMHADDWGAVAEIYRQGIETGNATLETAVPDYATWDQNHRADCRFVAEQDGQIIGWAALSPVSGRCVYGGVAEVSVYVAANARGQGVGKALLLALVTASEEAGIWTLQAGILRENEASQRLHEWCGFRVVGVREKLGQLHGVWRDVMLMERRSKVVGR
jgi:phosphinothricin acetyltransferase